MLHLELAILRSVRHKQQRPPPRVAVFTLYYAAVYNACMYLHRIMLCLSNRRSSNDLASIVGGALERIFQLLRDKIDHHIPSCTPPSCGQRNILPTTRQQRH